MAHVLNLVLDFEWTPMFQRCIIKCECNYGHQNHGVWSRALKCSVKPYMTGLSTKCYFDEFLFMQVLTHDKIE